MINDNRLCYNNLMNPIQEAQLNAIDAMIDQQAFSQARERLLELLENPLNTWSYQRLLEEKLERMDFLIRSSIPIKTNQILDLLKSDIPETQIQGLSQLTKALYNQNKSTIQKIVEKYSSDMQGVYVLKLKELKVDIVVLNQTSIDLNTMDDPFKSEEFIKALETLETIFIDQASSLTWAHSLFITEVLSFVPKNYSYNELIQIIQRLYQRAKQDNLKL